MVSTVEARETPRLHGPVAKFRSDNNMGLQKEKYLKVVLNRLGWSRHPSSLSVEDVCKVGQPASGKQARVMHTAVWLPVGHQHVSMLQALVADRSGQVQLFALQVIRACLQSASALHAKQLVHRDFRYANVLWDAEGPFVIDLEMAATPPLKVRHLCFLFSSFDNRYRARLR